jgi:hypothetical protein
MGVKRQAFVDSFRAAQREWATVQAAMQAMRVAQAAILEVSKLPS